tara:strand:- start:6364 stop:7269 length:906 start_codon:yes stop_codon:yes gene_type:complete
MEKNIFWLASYPKSGNTLLRSILISLFFTKDGIFKLNQSNKIDQFETTRLIVNNKNIFKDNIESLNKISVFYKYITALQTKKSLGIKEDFIFKKTHSGLFRIGNSDFTNENCSRGIIYVIRDPRDVCLSWGRHSGLSIEETIDFMTNELAVLKWVETSEYIKDYSMKNLPESFLSSWEKHVISWTSINWNVPRLVIKYEDLVYDKSNTIISIIDFFTKNYNFKFNNIDKKIENILISTKFEKMKEEEESKGFREATKYSKFFSVGKKNQWINKLNKKQISIIEKKCKILMKQFNYKLAVEI